MEKKYINNAKSGGEITFFYWYFFLYMDKLQVPAGAERTAYITAASVGVANLTRH